MRLKLTTCCLVILLGMGTNSFAQSQVTKTKTSNDESLPYKAWYSSQFRMNGQKYSPVVLNAWKGYDNNSFEGMSGILADTAMAILADGTAIRGKEKFMNAIKAYRGGFTAVESKVAAYMDFTSTDKNEDWVGIWGSETDTKSDGTKQTVVLHELWRFNKDGKVTLMQQFLQQGPRSNQ